MTYIVKAVKIISMNDRTMLEEYEKSCNNSSEACKEESRLRSSGDYANIRIVPTNEPSK
jgi:hypothetical protein